MLVAGRPVSAALCGSRFRAYLRRFGTPLPLRSPSGPFCPVALSKLKPDWISHWSGRPSWSKSVVIAARYTFQLVVVVVGAKPVAVDSMTSVFVPGASDTPAAVQCAKPLALVAGVPLTVMEATPAGPKARPLTVKNGWGVSVGEVTMTAGPVAA